MRILFAVLTLALSVFLVGGLGAGEDKKDTKLVGVICCPKCELKIVKKCATVIVVTRDEKKKKAVYWFDAAADKKHHEEICTEAKPGFVTGVLGKDGKRLTITVKTLEFTKE